MRRLASELGMPPEGPTTIMESKIAMAKNKQFHGRIRILCGILPAMVLNIQKLISA